MRCLICDHSEWENVDQYRSKKEGMSLCLHCGFISYPKRWKTKEEIIKHYRKNYRPAPTVDNLYSGQRKLHYHHEFLYPTVFSDWKQKGKKDPVVFEVGAAYGLVLAWMKNLREEAQPLFPDIELNGSELTTAYKRNAYHEFGLNLVDDFDDNKKYDLVLSYKVAEHMLDVDVELKRYRAALKPDGYLYISVPMWFHRMHNFGVGGFSIEYYYSPDHVNVWTREHFEYLLKKTGFNIVKQNHSYYDSAYLCVPAEPIDDKSTLPPVAYIKECLARVKVADEACQKKEFDKAVEAWPNFPIARRALYEYNRKDWHEKGMPEILKHVIQPWIELDPDSYEVFALAGDILMRYEKYPEALKYLKEALARRPKCETILSGISNCYRCLAEKAKSDDEKTHYSREARAIMRFIKDNCLSGFANATTWIYNDNANIPTPYEG